MSENKDWKIFEGTLIGPPSKKRDKPNQDYYGHKVIIGSNDNVFTVIVAADGAGSLELSHVGAQLATESVLNTLDDYLSQSQASVEQAAHIATYEARKTLIEHEDRSKLGCTIGFAILDHNNSEYAFSITGDAFGVIRYDNGEYDLIENPAAGEYANITKLLTSDNTDSTVYSGSLINDDDTADVEGIAVSSDGLAHFTIDNSTKEPTPGFWNTVFARAKEGSLDIIALFDYMNSLEKIDDDTTMVVAVLDDSDRQHIN